MPKANVMMLPKVKLVPRKMFPRMVPKVIMVPGMMYLVR